jgi:hypothetical protein
MFDTDIDPSSYGSKQEIFEKNLRFLYSVSIPESEVNSELANEILKLSLQIEQTYFSKIIEPVVKQIKSLSTDEQGFKEKEKIESQYGDTYCKICKTEIGKNISDFNLRYQNTVYNTLIRKNEEMNQQTISLLFTVFEKRKCVEKYLKSMQYDSLANFGDLLNIEITKIDTLIKETREALKLSNSNMSIEQIMNHNAQLESYQKRLEKGMQNFCDNHKGICDCKKE